MEQTNLERAKELFKKDPAATVAYFTKDGNMFRAKHYAEDWAKGANGGEVETIYKDAEKVKSEETAGDNDGSKKAASTKEAPAGEAEEKAELTKRYIELFDGKPNHLTGNKKLKELIAAKELELENAK